MPNRQLTPLGIKAETLHKVSISSTICNVSFSCYRTSLPSRCYIGRWIYRNAQIDEVKGHVYDRTWPFPQYKKLGQEAIRLEIAKYWRGEEAEEEA